MRLLLDTHALLWASGAPERLSTAARAALLDDENDISFSIVSLLTLDAGGDIRFRSRLVEGAGSPEGVPPEQYLLDGQQRLTSLYQAMRHAGPVETRDQPVAADGSP